MVHSDNAACKIAEKMRQLLLSLEYSRSKEFLSSRQAAALYNVSHVTAARAIRLLAAEGLLTRGVRGSGTYVNKTIHFPRGWIAAIEGKPLTAKTSMKTCGQRS